MTNKFISIASIAAPKLDAFSIETDGKTIHVYDSNFIRLISQVFGVPYEIFFPPDGEVGRKLSDGNWSGMIRMMQKSEADLAIGIGLTYPRFQAVNFSYPYHFSDKTFMTDKPEPAPTYLALLHPFSLILWILLLVVIFLFSNLLFSYTYKKQTYQNIIFMLIGNLLEKSINIRARKLSLRMIIITWLLFTFIITNCYKAIFLSIVAIPPLTGIKNIADLAKAAEQNSVTCFTYKGSSTQQLLIESEFDTWRYIGKCLQRNVIASPDVISTFVSSQSKKAFITDRLYIKPYKQKFFISEDSLISSMHAFPLSRNFCCQSYLNERIHRLFAMGVFLKIHEDERFFIELKVTSSYPTSPGRLKILQLEDVKGPFIILLFGYALSTIVFVFEIAVNHFFPKSSVILNNKMKNTKNQTLNFKNM